MRARDRRTQLAEFQHAAQALFTHIGRETDKYNNKLGRFTVTHVRGAHHPLIEIPTGLDLVQVQNTSVVLSATHHNIQRHRKYAVASQGERCVLLVANYAVNAQQPPQLAVEWNEVAWYEGNPESIFSLVSVSYREWITSQLQELAHAILSSG